MAAPEIKKWRVHKSALDLKQPWIVSPPDDSPSEAFETHEDAVECMHRRQRENVEKYCRENPREAAAVAFLLLLAGRPEDAMKLDQMTKESQHAIEG